MIELQGNYLLKLDFGVEDKATNLDITSQNLKEFTIIQDINKFLPEIRIQLIDPLGVLTHLAPFDKNMSRISVQMGRDLSAESEDVTYNDYNFIVFRRQPQGQYTVSSHYDIRGLLDTEGIFVPNYCRSWNQSLRTTLTSIATDELNCDLVEISPSLDYPLHIV